MNIGLQIVIDINRLKTKLKAKAKKKGLCENSGQKEVEQLKEKYIGLNCNCVPREVYNLISKFNEWCKNFDQSDLRG